MDTMDWHREYGKSGKEKIVTKPKLTILTIIIVEFLIGISVSTVFYFFRFTDEIAVNTKRQFSNAFVVTHLSLPHKNCDDLLNKYPCFIYLSDAAFFLITILIPILLIILAEIAYDKFDQRPNKVLRIGTESSFLSFQRNLRRIVRFTALFLVGYVVTSCITDTIKNVAGIPRPFFLDLCKPDIDQSSPFQKELTCKVEISSMARSDAYRSFPSYRASLASYSTLLLIVYIENLKVLKNFKILRMVMIGILTSGHSMIVLERYINNHNSMLDLLIGMVIGTLTSLCLTMHILEKFQEHPISEDIPTNERSYPIQAFNSGIEMPTRMIPKLPNPDYSRRNPAFEPDDMKESYREKIKRRDFRY